MTECALHFDDLAGAVNLNERGKQDSQGLWESREILCREVEAVHLNIDSENDGLSIGLSVHHIANDETSKVFHVSIDCTLQLDDVKRLRDFLNLLLEWQRPRLSSVS